MAFELGDIIVRLKADTSDLERGFAEAGKSGDNLGSKLGSIFKTVAVGVAAAGTAVAAFGALSVKAYSEHEEVFAQVNQVLETTGKKSQISAKQVEDLAMSMERYSGKSHDAIAQGQTLLLQFSQTTSKNLPEMTKAMLDLSQRMGVDTVTAAKQLGIALDSPTTGMARLRRSGIDFTEDQKKAIKALQDSGNIAGADALLMKGLEEKVGGAAGAYRNTFGGALESAKLSMHDFEEKVGGTIANYLEPLAKKAANALVAIDWQKVIDNTIATLKEWDKELDKAWQWLDKIYQQVEHYLAPKLEALWKSIEGAFPVFRKFIDEYINPLVEVLGPAVGVGLVWAIGAIIDIATILLRDILTPLFKFMDDHKDVVLGLAGAFGILALNMALGAAFDTITIAIATFQTITIPSLMATLTSLGAAWWAAFPLAAVAAAAVIAFELIMNAAQKTLAQLDKTNQAIKSASSSDDAAMLSIENAYKAGKISKAQEVKMINDIAGRNAAGTNNWRGGLTWVGEQGPELLNLPKGSQIIPNDKSMAMTSNKSTNIYGNINIDSPQDADYFFKRMDRNSLLESMGGSPLS